MAFELRVDHGVYDGKISELETCVARFEIKKDQYNALKERINSVFGEDDDNYDNARAMVDSAIKVVDQKIRATRECIRVLRQTVSSTSSASSSVSGMLDEATNVMQSLLR